VSGFRPRANGPAGFCGQGPSRQIDECKPPPYTEDSSDWDYKKQWLAGFLRHLEKRNDLIWQFVQAFPDHERARPLMEEWYTNLGGGTVPAAINERVDKAVLEIDSLLVNKPPTGSS